MDDDLLVAEFEATTLPELSHRDHVRLVFLYNKTGDAAARTRAGLIAYTAARGSSSAFHETRTWAWAQLIAAAAHGYDDFDAFWAAHPEFDRRDLLGDYYSGELLNSPEARASIVQPDLAPLTPR
jgi:hypothetical protein